MSCRGLLLWLRWVGAVATPGREARAKIGWLQTVLGWVPNGDVSLNPRLKISLTKCLARIADCCSSLTNLTNKPPRITQANLTN
jgi:hypothetical protein